MKHCGREPKPSDWALQLSHHCICSYSKRQSLNFVYFPKNADVQKHIYPFTEGFNIFTYTPNDSTQSANGFCGIKFIKYT
jgi:hypothetical protein